MVILPFQVQSGGSQFTFTDRAALDSEAMGWQVDRLHAMALDATQPAARCENRGVAARREIDNKIFAVTDGAGDLVGIWMLGSIEYISGPWSDLQSWEVTSPGEDVILEAVPMSGMIGMDEEAEADFAAATARHLVKTPNLGCMSAEGTMVGFGALKYAIFKDHDDPISIRAKKHHARVMADPLLDVEEVADANDLSMTLVRIRAK